MARKPTTTATNEEEARRRASDDFALARSRAINEYADFERNLAMLTGTILNVDVQKGLIVFASVRDAQARMRMIKGLLRACYGDKYSTFFSSMSKQLTGLDARRNRIVHWIAMTSQTGGERFDPKRDIFLLEHPDVGGRKIYKHELQDFTRQADFYRLLVFYFGLYLQNIPLPVAPGKRPWHDIFHEEVSCPPDTGV